MTKTNKKETKVQENTSKGAKKKPLGRNDLIADRGNIYVFKEMNQFLSLKLI